MPSIGWVAMGGVVGTLCRFGLGEWMHTLLGTRFPYGTLTVNTIGCILIGWAGVAAEERGLGSAFWLLVVIGFLGSFTTFSSWAYESWMLMRESSYWLAAGNMAANMVLGFGGILVGVAVGKWL